MAVYSSVKVDAQAARTNNHQPGWRPVSELLMLRSQRLRVELAKLLINCPQGRHIDL
jgi:hypothetical protein